MPTYHLANIVDDYLMQITHVIRGEEWLPSTPIHVLLYRFLGWEEVMPEFAHLPLILKPDGNGKLSKRDGDRLGFPVFPLNWTNPETGEQSLGFRERGFLPEAFMNMLAFLGWNPGTQQELFTKEELITDFSLERVSKSGAKFDFEKAKWFNQQYIKLRPAESLLTELTGRWTEIQAAKDPQFLSQYVELFKDRVTFIADFTTVGNYMFEKPAAYDEAQFRKRWKDSIPSVFQGIKSSLAALESFQATDVEAIVKGAIHDHQLKMGEVLPVFRIMISGEAGGPPLFDIAAMLGQAEVLERMDAAINFFS
jgi:glutamyl-tRNA synthetase